MKMPHKILCGIGLLFTTILISPVFAHQPRITSQTTTQVIDPEISKAYYFELLGEPQRYVIEAPESFDLYVNILVPDNAGQKKDVTAKVYKNGDYDHPIATIGEYW